MELTQHITILRLARSMMIRHMNTLLILYKNLVNNDKTYMTTLLILYKNDVSAPR
jgi:hypothetical protein